MRYAPTSRSVPYSDQVRIAERKSPVRGAPPAVELAAAAVSLRSDLGKDPDRRRGRGIAGFGAADRRRWDA